MNIYRRFVLILIIAMLALTPLAAQSPEKPKTPADPTTIDQEKPPKPKIELYGYLKLDGSWDDSIIDAGNFSRWVASTSVVEEHEHFNMTARQSRLGMRIVREQDGNLIVKGRIEIDFYGGGAENKNLLMLRHGYIEVDWPDKGLNLKAGQTSDLISPLVPTTINYPVSWWAGNIGYRRPQLRLTKTVKTGDKGSVAFAAAISRSIGDDFAKLEPGDSGADSGIPTVQLALSRRFSLAGKAASVGISGHLGKEELHERFGDPAPEFDSWSVGLDYSLPLSAKFTLKGELWTGQDLDEYLGGIGQGINRATNKEIESSGGWLSLEGRPTAKAFVGIGASLDDPDDENLLSGARARNSAAWINYLYDVRSYLRTGIELSHWSTDYLGLEDSSAFRVQGTLIYTF